MTERCCYEAAPGLRCPKRARKHGYCKRHAGTVRGGGDLGLLIANPPNAYWKKKADKAEELARMNENAGLPWYY